MRIALAWCMCLMYVFAESIVSEGEKVYDQKCLSCHQKFISMDRLKTNFLDKNNRDLIILKGRISGRILS